SLPPHRCEPFVVSQCSRGTVSLLPKILFARTRRRGHPRRYTRKLDRMILYNLFPLLAGPFPRWGEHFARAAGMGFDWVFVNPIQHLGASRSLYSICDYFKLNSAFVDPATTGSPDDQCRHALNVGRATG